MPEPRAYLTFANVTSVIALAIALGGTAVAAGLIDSKDVQNNALTGKDIKRESLKGNDVKKATIQLSDLGDSSVASAEVVDGSLTTSDFVPGTIPSPDATLGQGKRCAVCSAPRWPRTNRARRTRPARG